MHDWQTRQPNGFFKDSPKAQCSAECAKLVPGRRALSTSGVKLRFISSLSTLLMVGFPYRDIVTIATSRTFDV